jgi:hypothetical protein
VIRRSTSLLLLQGLRQQGQSVAISSPSRSRKAVHDTLQGFQLGFSFVWLLLLRLVMLLLLMLLLVVLLLLLVVLLLLLVMLLMLLRVMLWLLLSVMLWLLLLMMLLVMLWLLLLLERQGQGGWIQAC